jgi:hypothetical protein
MTPITRRSTKSLAGAMVAALALLVGALPMPMSVAAAGELLTGERLWYAPGASGIDEESYVGSLTGSFDCAAGSFEAAVEGGNAYGPYPGSFSHALTFAWMGGEVGQFDLDFEIEADDTTVSGTASWAGNYVEVTCTSDEEDGEVFTKLRLSEPVELSYSAEFDGAGGQASESGSMRASIGFDCGERTDDLSLFCEGSIFLTFGPPPTTPPYVPPAPYMVVSNSMGSSIGSFEGTTSGSFSCGALSVLDMDVAGNAYGPYPGTFTESVHVALQGDLVEAFDVQFTILSGDTTVTGSASYPGGTADGHCGTSFEEDDGLSYNFGVGVIQLQYEATIESPEATTTVAGWASASVNLYCLGSSMFTENCAVATSILEWLVPDVVGEDGEASTGDAVDEENPSAVSVSNPAGGTIEITRTYASSGQSSSYIVLGQSYIVEAENPASVNDPMVFTFLLHSALLYDYENDEPIDPASVTVLRNGEPAGACSASGLVADPDPCVYSRTIDGDGNLKLVILSSYASLWSVVALRAGDPTAAAIADAVESLPTSAFKARGSRDALVSRLTETQRSIDAGRNAIAVRQLANLRRQVDGCGSKADRDDLIVSCPAQLEIRNLVDELIAHLGG